jgi:hypothetical protein
MSFAGDAGVKLDSMPLKFNRHCLQHVFTSVHGVSPCSSPMILACHGTDFFFVIVLVITGVLPWNVFHAFDSGITVSIGSGR